MTSAVLPPRRIEMPQPTPVPAPASTITSMDAPSDNVRRRARLGQIGALAAGAGMLAGALWFGTPLLLAVGCFFVLMTAQGLIITNGGALASAEVPDHPGTGSAVLGFVQWVVVGLTAPIAGLGGEDTAVPMALLMIAGTVASMIGLLVLARPGNRRPRTQLLPGTPTSP